MAAALSALLLLSAFQQPGPMPEPTEAAAEARWKQLWASGDGEAIDGFLRSERPRLFDLAHGALNLGLLDVANGRASAFAQADRIAAAYGVLRDLSSTEERQRNSIRRRRDLFARMGREAAGKYLRAYFQILGVDMRAAGTHPDEAAAALRSALAVIADSPDPFEETVARIQIGELLRRGGRYRRAVEDIDRILTIQVEQGDVRGAAEACLLAGRAYSGLQDYRSQLGYLQRAADLAKECGHPRLEAQAQRELANVLSYLKQGDEALQRAQRALELCEPADRLRILSSIGVTHERSGRSEKAVEFYEQVLKEAKLPEDFEVKSLTLNNLAALHHSAGRYREAAALIEEALGLTGTEMAPGVRTMLMMNLAGDRGALGETRKALEGFEEALTLSKQEGIPELEAEVLTQWAALLIIHPEGLKDAARMLKEAIRITESVRLSLGMLEREKQGWFRSNRDRYELAALALRRSDDAGGAIQTLELMRARTLTDRMVPRAEQDRNIPAELTKGKEELVERLNRRNRERSTAARELLQAKEEGRAAARKRLEAADADLAVLERDLVDIGRRIEVLQSPGAGGLVDVGSVLQKDEALILYSMITIRPASGPAWPPELMIGVILRGEYFVVETIPYPGFAEDIARFRMMAMDSGRGLPPAAFKKVARNLYGALLQPIAKDLRKRSVRKLTIVPDGALYSIPFEALLESDAGTEYADLDYVQRHDEVGYASSAALLGMDRARPPRPARSAFVGFGNPRYGATQTRDGARWPRLPGSADEVKLAGACFAAQALYTEENATEARVHDPELLRDAKVLHFACHAFVDGEDPMKSALVLAADEKYDGLLEAREIADLNLPVDLVVLSACDSGSGKSVTGEGLFGLTRGFIVAGARSIAVSLWPVADAGGRDFMVAFHRKVAAGMTPAQALSEVKNDWIRRPSTAAPFHWAGFVLHGS